MTIDPTSAGGLALLGGAIGWAWRQFSGLYKSLAKTNEKVTKAEVEITQLRETTSMQRADHERLLTRMDERHAAIMARLEVLPRMEETLRYMDQTLRSTLTRAEWEQSQKAVEQRLSRLEESLERK
jgi:chromosome segregation ATPase